FGLPFRQLWYILLLFVLIIFFFAFFFFIDPATTDIYTLSLHDALPILTQRRATDFSNSVRVTEIDPDVAIFHSWLDWVAQIEPADRKSTRLNSSHVAISYAVFCLKKKKNNLIKNVFPYCWRVCTL